MKMNIEQIKEIIPHRDPFLLIDEIEDLKEFGFCNFSIDGKRLAGEISKTGANRSLWLYPTIYMTTLFFGVGLLLIPIRGGHAKIKPQQTFTVYYQH